LGKYFTILPAIPKFDLNEYIIEFSAKKVREGFSYDSGTNTQWETVESLRNHIIEHVDSNFKINEFSG
jgi:hypothetical protein